MIDEVASSPVETANALMENLKVSRSLSRACSRRLRPERIGALARDHLANDRLIARASKFASHYPR